MLRSVYAGCRFRAAWYATKLHTMQAPVSPLPLRERGRGRGGKQRIYVRSISVRPLRRIAEQIVDARQQRDRMRD
ncbi:hypothetical protein, partial [Plasticicumulans sp.]|uniref:hypothetical protein n=1 Tax=Plasticicumulans sp. TaxID=2307179 RepID=UPI002D1FA84A